MKGYCLRCKRTDADKKDSKDWVCIDCSELLRTGENK